MLVKISNTRDSLSLNCWVFQMTFNDCSVLLHTPLTPPPPPPPPAPTHAHRAQNNVSWYAGHGDYRFHFWLIKRHFCPVNSGIKKQGSDAFSPDLRSLIPRTPFKLTLYSIDSHWPLTARYLEPWHTPSPAPCTHLQHTSTPSRHTYSSPHLQDISLPLFLHLLSQHQI